MSYSTLSFNSRYNIVCASCKRFENQVEVLQSKSQQETMRDPFLLHKNFIELEARAIKGCSICRIIRMALLRECFSREYKDLRASSESVFVTFPATKDRVTSFFAEVKTSDSLSFRAKIILKLSTHPDTKDFVLTSANATDPSVFKQAEGWLQTCAGQHFECTERMEIGDPPHNPSRLLYIGTSESPSIKIIVPPTKLLMYCALSYCWGGGGSLRTTRENISEHMKGIPMSSFAGTLFDAITVSRKLGIRFIWIDALCIIQDDAEDFALESVRMHKVYGHAILTLSICSSKSATESFLIRREAETLRLNRRELAGSRLSLEEKTLEDVRARSPLMKRAWTFQEELLSPRILYWSDHGIFWNCSRRQCAENSSEDHEPARNYNKNWNDTIEAYSKRELSNENDRLTALSGIASKFISNNPSLLDGYHATGALHRAAFNGAASNQTRPMSTTDEYVAGLWQSTIPGSLLWNVHGAPKLPKPIDPEVPVFYVAPSWSWASLPAGQSIKAATDSHPENCQFKEKIIKLKGSDPHGPLEHASMTLEGNVRPLFFTDSQLIKWPLAETTEAKEIKYPSLFRPKHTHSINEHKGQVMVSPGKNKWVIIKMDRSPISPSQDMDCFQIGSGFLVLRKIIQETTGQNDDPSTAGKTLYYRVGCGTIDNCPDFFANAVRREVTIL